MRVFALSDIHVDYDSNARWVAKLSTSEYRDDVLIVAGDVSDRLASIDWCLRTLAHRFRQVLFVPGNHELWVVRDDPSKNSLDKFREVAVVVDEAGASMRPFHHEGLCIVPLLGWYDYTFGQPGEALRGAWMDYVACRWPDGMTAPDISLHFSALNPGRLPQDVERVMTFSHFMPRIDLMPASIPAAQRMLYPILGSTRIDSQLRQLNSQLHVYGHSHVNRQKVVEGVRYINNAFGYPHEEHITAKRLMHIQVP